MKIERGQGKAVLKSALRRYLDDETLYRRKQGFTPPLRQWLRGPLKELAGDLLLGPGAASAAWLRPQAVRRAWDAHQSLLRDNTPLLYGLMMLELWARRFLGADPSQS
jgi:asparagine synthase (glutamine-hydrolysing)